MARVAKILTIAGFSLAIVAFAAAAADFHRSTAVVAFSVAFILGALGIGIRWLAATSEVFPFSPLGPKLIAVGFLVLAIPSAVIVFILKRPEEDANSFWWAGIFIVVVGFVVTFFDAVRRRDNDG